MPPPWRTAYLVVCSRIPGMSGDEECIGKRMLLLMTEGLVRLLRNRSAPRLQLAWAPSALDE